MLCYVMLCYIIYIYIFIYLFIIIYYYIIYYIILYILLQGACAHAIFLLHSAHSASSRAVQNFWVSQVTAGAPFRAQLHGELQHRPRFLLSAWGIQLQAPAGALQSTTTTTTTATTARILPLVGHADSACRTSIHHVTMSSSNSLACFLAPELPAI